jgi:hypothetical protein
MDAETTIRTLDDLASKGAATIIEFIEQIDRTQYIGVVNVMYHYTLGSERRLSSAAGKATEPDLHRLLSHMVEEEKDHYQLAVNDLQALGRVPTPEKLERVLRYEEHWFGLTTESQFGYAGLLYVLESIPPLLAPASLRGIVRLDLRADQTEFLRLHLEADVEHSGLAKAICEKHADKFGDQMIEAGRESCARWVHMLSEPFGR